MRIAAVILIVVLAAVDFLWGLLHLAGGAAMFHGLLLLVFSGLAIGAGLTLLKGAAPGFALGVGVLQGGAEGIRLNLWQSIGLADLLAAGAAVLAIAVAYRALKSRASGVKKPAVGIAESGQDDDLRPYAFIASAPGEHEAVSRRRVANEEVRRFLVLRDIDRAYTVYAARIEKDPVLEFEQALEAELVEGLLSRCDFEKAGKVLEHSLATHPAEASTPRVYFNLGYIHVMTRELCKARRFFRLFLRLSPHAIYRAQARQILRAIERLCAKGGRAPEGDVLIHALRA